MTEAEGGRSRSAARRVAAVVLALLANGCAGGSPLLHPAHTLAAGDVRAAAGVSANVATGSLSSSLDAARTEAATNGVGTGGQAATPSYARGALVAASVAPGLAPYVGARVGIGNAFEGGLAYTGRSTRLDVRHAFERGPYALSIGVGGSAALYGRQESDLPNVDLGSLRGYGADVPVLFGIRSEGDLYAAWIGPRVGVEWVTIERLTSEPRPAPAGSPTSLEATRWYAGGTVGLATGFRHVHVALEGSVSYQSARGTYGAQSVRVDGWTIVPSTAIWWTF